MTQDEVIQLYARAVAIFPREAPDSPIVWQIYHELLSDLDFDSALIAMERLLCAARFFPKPAEVREVVAEVEGRRLPSLNSVWMMVVEWAEAEEAIYDAQCCRDGRAMPSSVELPQPIRDTINTFVRRDEVAWLFLLKHLEDPYFRNSLAKQLEQAIASHNRAAVLPLTNFARALPAGTAVAGIASLTRSAPQDADAPSDADPLSSMGPTGAAMFG